jgi:hypothetical protein
VRRAKLYYLRGLTGRAARIKERRRPEGSIHLRGVTSQVISAPAEAEYEEPLAAAEVEEIEPAEDLDTFEAAAEPEESEVTEEADGTEESKS